MDITLRNRIFGLAAAALGVAACGGSTPQPASPAAGNSAPAPAAAATTAGSEAAASTPATPAADTKPAATTATKKKKPASEGSCGAGSCSAKK